MSLLSPTRIKAMPVNERMQLVSTATSAVYTNLNVEIQKDLTLVVVNSNSNTDYAGATLSLTGTKLNNAGGFWFTSALSPIQGGELTNNVLSLKRGTTTLKVSSVNLSEYKTIRLDVTGTADSTVNVYAIWDDAAPLGDWITVSASAPLSKFKTTEKNWKLTIIPKGVDDNNLVRVYTTKNGGVWSSSDLLSKYPLTQVDNYVYITTPTEIYLNNIYQLAEVLLIVSCTGTATAAVKVESPDEPVDASEFYKKLFTTAVNSGSAYNFVPDLRATHVLCRIDSTLVSGGSAVVHLYPRSTDNLSLSALFNEPGSSSAPSNSVSITTSDTRYLYLPRTVQLGKVHADCVMTGTGNSVRVSMANYFGELPKAAEAAAGAVTSNLYSGEGFSVDRHATARQFAAYENWTASVSLSDVLTVSVGSNSAQVSLSALPGWKSGDTIGAMGFIPYRQGGPTAANYSRETAMRLCFFTRLGNIYHNYPAAASDDSTTSGGMGAFDLSAVYEPVVWSGGTVLSSERIPSNNPALTADEKKLYRYEPGLPSWNYNQHTNNVGGLKADGSAYGGGGLPPVMDKNGLKLIRMVHPFEFGTNPQDASKPYQMSGYLSNPFSVKPKCTIYTPYNGLNVCKNVVLGTTDGGRIWVVLHELGCNSVQAICGNNFDYSAVGAYTSGALSVVKRTYIYPTSSVKDPVNCFQYADPISVTAITTTGGKASVTTSTPHGFTTGDLICFKKNSSGNYDFLENSVTVGNAAAFSSNSAGDGRFYRVKVTSTTTFELLQNYNGVDEKIATHHIHSSNPAKDGTLICCGEKYPAGWILFVRIPQIDDFEYFYIYQYRISNRYIFRLNSSETAMQRAVGMVWRDDQEQTFLFASDEQNIAPRPVTIPGRDAAAVPSRNTAGVFLGKMADIDDITKAYVVCEMEEASLGLINAQNMFVVVGMSRKTYLSADGKNWVSFPLICQYVGESNGALYLRADTYVYRVTKT